MRTRNVFIVSVLVALAAWALFTWPLPRYADTAIPAGSQAAGFSDIQEMPPGDHLQLLYHFWLFGDMLAGHTPWFHNLYEFNTGDDAARFRVHHYFLPFSAVYAAATHVMSRALAWNLAGLLSMVTAYFFTWLLLRRFTDQPVLAALFALVALVFPYRWNMLLGGSPGGFASAWIPAVLLGLDIAIREEKARGGFLAGLAFLFCNTGDTHVFYFTALAMPVWALWMLVITTPPRFRERSRCLALLKALAPTIALGALTFAYSIYTLLVVKSADEPKRSWRVVGHFSPHKEDILSATGPGAQQHVFMGYTLVVFLVVTIVLFLLAWFLRRARDRRALATLLLLAGGGLVVLALALGTNGPLGAEPFSWVRRNLPGYGMIRQPGKIMCLAPTLFALLALLAFDGTRKLFRGHPALYSLLACWLVLLLAEYRVAIRPLLCLLDPAQQAYAAVAEDARDQNREPHALIIPLWPGDAADCSVYQYYASLYRMRMVNGYSPVMPAGYFEDTFRHFQGVNQGVLTPARLDELLAAGVGHVLFHEDLFPWKVSPFPSGFTLQQLLRNPRLEYLRQDEGVHAFRIRPEPVAEAPPSPAWALGAPTRRYELERSLHRVAETESREDARLGACLAFRKKDARVRTKATYITHVPGLRWRVRVRGEGELTVQRLVDDEPQFEMPLRVKSKAWTWEDLPLEPYEGTRPIALRMVWEEGAVDADTALLTLPGPGPLFPGDHLAWPAAALFHEGYTRLDDGAVIVEQPPRSGASTVLWGPYLPLAAGTYELTLTFTAEVRPPGRGDIVEVGRLTAHPHPDTQPSVPLRVGEHARLTFEHTSNLPFHLEVTHFGNSRLELTGVRLERIE